MIMSGTFFGNYRERKSSTSAIADIVSDWKTLSLEKYKQWMVRFTGFMGRTLLALQNQSSFQKCLLTELCKGYLNFPFNLKHICNFLRNSDLPDLSHFLADRSNRSNQIEIINCQDR